MGIEDLRIPPDEAKKAVVTIYGNPGAGKTVLASRLANKSVLLTNENGWKVLPNNHPKLYESVVPMKFEGLQSIAKAIKAIREDSEVDHLILDTISGMVTKKMTDNLRNKEIKFNRVHDEVFAQQDYLLAYSQWQPIISNLSTCGVNITILCHLRFPTPDSKTGSIPVGETTRPDLPKAIFNLVNQYSQVVAYLRKDGIGSKRLVTTQGTGSLTAKDQTNIEAKDISDDTFVEAIRKSRGL